MIQESLIESVVLAVKKEGTGDSLLKLLKANHPDTYFSCCNDEDVFGPDPIYASQTFNLYLVDSSDHCLSLTKDKEVASGILIARVTDLE